MWASLSDNDLRSTDFSNLLHVPGVSVSRNDDRRAEE